MTKHLRLTWFWLQEKKRLQFVGIFLVLVALILIFWIQSAKGAAYTWDGGGTDGTCGGAAGDGNKWSCAANWSSDITPSASDTVTFNGTSTKDATISGTVSVAGMTIASGYTGTITQSGSNTLTVGTSGYSQAAGTFTGGSGSITISTTYTLSGGTFTSTTGTFQIFNGTWTHTAGGTFNHNSGTVQVRGTGNASMDVATNETFNNLTVQMDGGTSFTIGTGDTLIALGTYSQIGSGRIMAGTIEPRGPVTTTGLASVTATGIISFLVAGDQTIASTTGSLPNVSINKPSGIVSVTGDLSIGAFTLSSGTFTSTTGTLTVNNNTWTHTAGGTFNHNSGTVLFRGTGSITVDVATSETFNNLTVNLDGGVIFTVSSGDTLVALGTLSLIGAGNINTGTIEPRAAVTTTSTGAGTGTISFLTTGDQTITSTSGRVPNLNIAKSSGTVTVSGDLTFVTFTQSAGAFNGGTGTLTDSGSFTLSGGTFTSTTGNLTVGPNGTATWTHTAGGTFVANGGLVTFAPSSGTDTIDVATTETFYDLTVNGFDLNRIVAISSGDTLVVTHTFNHTNGTLNTGTVEARGNVVVGASAPGGSATISFLVAGDQTITGNGGQTVNLSIAKASGALSAGSTNLKIKNFTLSSGTFTSTSGTLTLIDGGWTHTAGGTFDHNSGTVTFAPTSGTYVLDFIDSETFNNLIVNGIDVNRVTQITAGDTAIVLGTFTHTNGSLTAGTVEARGNVSVGGSAPGGSATILFAVAGDQTITGNGGTTVKLRIDKPSGTVSAGSTNITLYGLAIYRGTFTASSGTTTFSDGSAIVHNGGVFNHNNGTISFTMPSTGATWTATTPDRVNNLIVNGFDLNRPLTIASGTKLIVEGTFTHTNGTLNTGTLEALGNVSIGAGADGGSAALIFAGDATQTYTDAGGTKTTGTVTINKMPGTKVTLASAMTYNGASQAFNIVSGILDQGASYALSLAVPTISSQGMLVNTGTGALTLAGTLTNSGTVYMNSNGVACGDTDSILIRSSVNTTQRSWNGTGKFFLADLDVRDMGGSATITTSSSTSTSGNGANWTFNSTCPPAVTSPNGGESWDTRASKSITFSSYAGADHYRLMYSTDGGASWTLIATTSASPYTWTLPAVGTTKARIMVAAENSGNTVLAQDLSDADFTILATGTQLNGGLLLNGGITF